jgi:uroporphyrinogen-III synthase
MGALIRLLCEHLEDSCISRLPTEFGQVELRGRVVVVDGVRATLSPVALALFRALIAAEGATLSRSVLSAAAPEVLDDHAVDVAISRLRQALPDGRIVATVIKRGYRIAANRD